MRLSPNRRDLSPSVGPALDDAPTYSSTSPNAPRYALRTRPPSRLRPLSADPLVRNSMFLMANTATMALFGFTFWLLVAHFYPPRQVGVAATLISSMNAMANLSLLGFNTTFVRYLPRSRRRNAEINTGLTLVGGLALVLSVTYVVVAPLITPRLGLLSANHWVSLGFVLLTIGAGVNLVTDSIFIAYRSAKFNLLIDGLIGSSMQIILAVSLISLGSFGIYAAQGSAALAAMVCSIGFLIAKFGFKARPRVDRGVLADVMRYSSLNYAANLLNIVPTLVLPVIVLSALGPAAAGFYYLAFMMANLLFTIGFAVSQAMFAEGSYSERSLKQLALRAGALVGGIMVPASIVFAVVGPKVLSVFGSDYAAHSRDTLILLGIAGPIVGIYTLSSAMLQILHLSKVRVVANAIYAVVICGTAVALADRGIAWVAGAWLIGNAVAATFMLAAIAWHRLTTRAAADHTNVLPSRKELPVSLHHPASGSVASPVSPMRILVVNAFIREAVGDAALLSVLLTQLDQAFPGSCIEVSSLEDPRLHIDFEGRHNLGSSRRYGADETVSRPVRAGRKALMSAIGMAWFRGHRVGRVAGVYRRVGGLLPDEVGRELEAIANADLVVSVGGGYLNGTPNLSGDLSVYSNLVPITLANRLGKVVICAPQSFGPYGRPPQRRAVRTALNKTDLVLVREDKSLRLLQDVGVNPDRLNRAIDSAFALRRGKVGDWRRRLGVDDQTCLVGVTARQWLDPDAQQRYEGMLAELIDHVQSDPLRRVVLIPQVISDLAGEDDRVVNRRIAGFCVGPSPILIDGVHDLYDIKDLYAAMTFVVGMRFHSVIFALTNRVPAIAIDYHHKARGIMADLGLSRWVLRLESLTALRLIDRFEDLLIERAAYEAHLDAVLPAYMEQANDVVRVMAATYESRRAGAAMRVSS
jgi:colanic acid/amylovoran biosynthesis protein